MRWLSSQLLVPEPHQDAQDCFFAASDPSVTGIFIFIGTASYRLGALLSNASTPPPRFPQHQQPFFSSGRFTALILSG